MPLVIYVTQRLGAGQSILSYVEMHKVKDGTPTMGGVGFIVSTIITTMFLLRENSRLATIMVLCFVFFGLIGFLDDFIKVRFKQNLGLTVMQKIFAQVAIAIALGVYAYNSALVGSSVIIPFSNFEIDIGFLIIPFVALVILATVNSVNLIDGLDGLCGGVSSVVLVVFVIVGLISIDGSTIYMQEASNMHTVMGALVGGLMAFLVYNSKPAKVFMGDTGSLAIGGMIAGYITLTKQHLLVLIVGVLYVVTALSVIMQVVYFKLTKKRIFKMAPIHHHYEMKYGETKVVAIYVIVAIMVGVVTILGYM